MIPKFRAWIKSDKKMKDVLSIDFITKSIETESDEVYEDISYFPEIILMQSTGLRDINGVEIYEGDIIVLYSYIVRYLQEELEWFFVNIDEDELYKISSLKWDELEIIGNIYENPKLLEEQL